MAAIDLNSSWWLKVERAEQHLADIKAAIGPAVEPNLSRFRVEKEPVQGGWRYSVHVDFEPPRLVLLTIGDFLFNLRSALDHVAAASPKNPATVGRLEGKFPIFAKDPRIPDPNNPKGNTPWLRGWNKVVDYTDPRVFAVMERVQPFTEAKLTGADPRDDPLAILNNLQNADKHTSLNIMLVGIRNFIVAVNKQTGEIVPGPHIPPDSILENGTELFIDPIEMDMELIGTAAVAITGGIETEYRFIPDAFDKFVSAVKAVLRMVDVIR